MFLNFNYFFLGFKSSKEFSANRTKCGVSEAHKKNLKSLKRRLPAGAGAGSPIRI